MTTTTERCDSCHGLGEVPMHYKTGPRQFTCNWERCRTCNGAGVVQGPDGPDTITVGGYQLRAPGFTADSFDRAICRAYSDGLRVGATNMPDMFTVTNPGSAVTYGTTRQACTCKAGHAGMGCKHRAMLIMELDIIGMPDTAAAA